MNKNKQYIYDFRENAPKVRTIDLWLKKYKPQADIWLKTYKECYYIIDKPKHRHRRSITIRKLKLLLSWDEKSFEELNCWCEHGVTCKVKKHRVFVYTY